MRLDRFLDRTLYPSAPAERLALFRLLVGAFTFGLCAARFGAFVSVSGLGRGQFAPVGVVRLLDAPLPAALVVILHVLSLLGSAAIALGYRYRILAPLGAAAFLWTSSYRSSFGMVFHTENLLALHLFALAFAPAADALSLDARAGRASAGAPSGTYGWALRTASLLTVVVYFVAGVAKLKLSGLGWASGDILRTQIAYDNVRKLELGSLHSPLGAWLVHAQWLFPPLALTTLAFELGGAVALIGRRAALVWCAGIWAFHVGVLLTMAIAFPYPLSLVPMTSLFALEETRLARWARRWLAPSG